MTKSKRRKAASNRTAPKAKGSATRHGAFSSAAKKGRRRPTGLYLLLSAAVGVAIVLGASVIG